MGIPRILLQKNSASTFAFVFLISFSLSLKYDSDNYHSWFWRLCWFPCDVGGAVSPVLVFSWHNLNMRCDFCNQVFSFSENDLEDDDKLDCTGGYDNDDDDIYIMMKCPYVYCMYVFASFLMECKEFILSDWSPPDDPARPCRPMAGYVLVIMMMMMMILGWIVKEGMM